MENEGILAQFGRPAGDLLEALAWQEGEGVPSRLLPALAAAVTGRACTGAEVTAMLASAAEYLREATIDGRVVYRLADDEVGEELRGATLARGVRPADVHAGITDALLAFGRGPGGWAGGDPYLEGVLPRHAALGERVEALCSEPGYLETADPDAVLAALPVIGDASVRTYRRAAVGLRGRTASERALALDIAAVAGGEPRRAPIGLGGGPRVRWRRGPPARHRQDLLGQDGWVEALAVGTIDNEPVAVTSHDDGGVLLWDVRTGTLRNRFGYARSVSAVAIGLIDNEPVIVTGHDKGAVSLWDVRTGTLLDRLLENIGFKRVMAVATGVVDATPVVVAGGYDDWGDECSMGTLRIWDARSGRSRLLGKRIENGVDNFVRALAVTVVDDQPIIVAGSSRWGVCLWDARTGYSRGVLSHPGDVNAVAVGVLDDQPIIVSGGADGAVRVWDARTGTPLRYQHLLHHDDQVETVAVGIIDNRTVIVSGGRDRAVRVWDARTGTPRGEPLYCDSWRVTAVAVVAIDDQPIIVAGFGRTVRLWDISAVEPLGDHGRDQPERMWVWGVTTIDEDDAVIVSKGDNGPGRLWNARTGEFHGAPLRGFLADVTGVAVATVDGRPVIIAGTRNGSVGLWDPGTGERRVPFFSHEAFRGLGLAWAEVTAVAIGVIDDQPVIIFGHDDGTVRLWDARSGEARGKPLRFRRWPRWRRVRTVALGVVGEQPVIVAEGFNEAVRLWDARTGKPFGRQLRRRGEAGTTLDAIIDGQPVLVSIDSDGTTHLLDPRTNRPWAGREVAGGFLDGEPVVACESNDAVLVFGPRTDMVLPILATVTSVVIVEGGLAIGTSSSLLVVDLPGLSPLPSGPDCDG